MINVKTGNGVIEISIEGNLSTLVADTSLIVFSVYEGIRKDNVLLAELFKRYFCEKGSVIFDEDVPVIVREPKRSSTDAMDMFINHLNELLAKFKAEKAKKEDK